MYTNWLISTKKAKITVFNLASCSFLTYSWSGGGFFWRKGWI